MKTLKKAEQKNVEINKEYYNEAEIRNMFLNDDVFFIKEKFEYEDYRDMICTSYTQWCKYDRKDTDLRIECENAELKVILNEYGHYTNVLIKNNKQYFVKL